MRRPARLVLLPLAGVLAGALAAQLPAAAQVSKFKPPPNGAPGGRVGGASRSASVPAGELPVIELLAPADQAGVTERADPTLYYFMSRPSRWPMQFTIAAPGQPAPVIDVRIAAPSAAGIYPISLARYRSRLQAGIDYTWSVSVVIDPHAWSHNVVASAAIVFDPAQGATLAGRPAPTAADFAGAGLWYDAIAAAAGAQPPDRAALDALLRQVGLEAVVDAEHREMAGQ